MATTIDDLTISYRENDLEVVKELDKVVLSRGLWTTILFRYQEWDNKKEQYGGDKYSIRRYQKRGDNYLPKSKFNISSRDQANKLIAALQQWLAEDG